MCCNTLSLFQLSLCCPAGAYSWGLRSRTATFSVDFLLSKKNICLNGHTGLNTSKMPKSFGNLCIKCR